jgi:hypothetical protein
MTLGASGLELEAAIRVDVVIDQGCEAAPVLRRHAIAPGGIGQHFLDLDDMQNSRLGGMWRTAFPL